MNIWKVTLGEFRVDDEVIFTGYAGGDGGLRPDAVNNPNMDHIPNVGPIPRGRYLIGAIHTKETDGKAWNGNFGPSYVRLTPDPANKMHGRFGFLAHWDRADRRTHPHSASEGCIIPYDGAMILELAKHKGEWLEVVA